jgi:phosphate/phosphite/phosphonate ABC transporter binding protein
VALSLFSQASDISAEKKKLRFLILPVEEVNIMFRQFLPIKRHMEQELGLEVELIVVRNYEAALDRLGEGEVDLAYLDPSAYCEGSFAHNLRPLAKVSKSGKDQYKSVFIVDKESKIDKIVDLRGKSLALGNVRSSSSYLMPLVMLKEIDLELQDLGKVGYLQKEDRVALSVLVGDYDVGALSQEVAKRYLPYGLRIIKYSETLPQFVVCASSRLSLGLQKKITKALLDYEPQEFENFSFVRARDREYNIVRIMLKNITGKDYISYPPNVLKLAVLPLYSPITLNNMFDPLVRYLSQSTGRTFRLLIPRDFEHFVHIVRSGQADFAYQNPYVYLLLASKIDFDPLALTISPEPDRPRDSFRGVIIVRKDSPIQDIQGLLGKKVMIVSHKSAGGYWFQKLYLRKKGINIDKQARILEGKRHEEVVLAVYRNEVQAGFVREAALEVVQEIVDLDEIEVLAYTDYYPNWPLAVTGQVKKKLTDKVKKVLISLDNPNLLQDARIMGFTRSSQADWQALEEQVDLP